MPSPLGLKPDKRVCCPVPDFPAYQCYWPTGLTLARIRALNGGAGRSTGAGRMVAKGHMARQVSMLGLHQEPSTTHAPILIHNLPLAP